MTNSLQCFPLPPLLLYLDVFGGTNSLGTGTTLPALLEEFLHTKPNSSQMEGSISWPKIRVSPLSSELLIPASAPAFPTHAGLFTPLMGTTEAFKLKCIRVEITSLISPCLFFFFKGSKGICTSECQAATGTELQSGAH